MCFLSRARKPAPRKRPSERSGGVLLRSVLLAGRQIKSAPQRLFVCVCVRTGRKRARLARYANDEISRERRARVSIRRLCREARTAPAVESAALASRAIVGRILLLFVWRVGALPLSRIRSLWITAGPVRLAGLKFRAWRHLNGNHRDALARTLIYWRNGAAPITKPVAGHSEVRAGPSLARALASASAEPVRTHKVH